jgi:hypothetical protein
MPGYCRMRVHFVIGLVIQFAFMFAPAFSHSQQAATEIVPREHFANADVVYDFVSNGRGDKLRTFVTRPKNISGKVPAIFFVGWLSCAALNTQKGKRMDLARSFAA